MLFLDQFNTFHDAATSATGLSDFGNGNYRKPMKRLLADFDKHTHFSKLGIDSISNEIIGSLIGRLKTQQGLTLFPETEHAPIQRPLIIIGLPRTGTTALLRLLFQDTDMQALPLWLANAPAARPPRATWESNPYYQQVNEGLKQLDELDPLFRQVHPMAADQPDECRLVMNHSFWSPTMAFLTNVPEYREWVFSSDPTYAYQYYRSVLGLIANGDSRRWLLKDPLHLFSLDTLLQTFPDACIVQTHREPITAITSITNLIYLLKNKREINLNPKQEGSLNLQYWANALNKAEKIRQQHPNPNQFYDIHIDETRSDPIGTVERMYQHFGFDISEQCRIRWQKILTQDPNLGHSAHHYSADFFGLTSERVNAAMGNYYDRFTQVEKNARRA